MWYLYCNHIYFKERSERRQKTETNREKGSMELWKLTIRGSLKDADDEEGVVGFGAEAETGAGAEDALDEVLCYYTLRSVHCILKNTNKQQGEKDRESVNIC